MKEVFGGYKVFSMFGRCASYPEAPDKSNGKRRQGIHIAYDLIGFIPLEELAQQETA